MIQAEAGRNRVALPTLVRVLHAESTQLLWIVNCHMIIYAGLVLVAGSLADSATSRRPSKERSAGGSSSTAVRREDE
jgi:hypothetical protein